MSDSAPDALTPSLPLGAPAPVLPLPGLRRRALRVLAAQPSLHARVALLDHGAGVVWGVPHFLGGSVECGWTRKEREAAQASYEAQGRVERMERAVAL